MGRRATPAGEVVTDAGGSASVRGADWVATEIERMISTGDLLPGQPVRQELMAERLGVSRLPIREGLRQLASQGLVEHRRNIGYAVVRLEQSEFDQIYLMRGVLEREVLATLPALDDDALTEIRALGDRVAEAAVRGDVLEMRLANQDFHFAIFDRSSLRLVVTEIRRLWRLATPYHAAYLFDAEVRRRVVAEHDAMIDALTDQDNERLVALMNEHRRGGEAGTNMLLRNTTRPNS
ncbi:GntR family transcriptional regulator [Rhodococcus coprophilus]|uniref:GntR family transcriptional regulator n=1 Tax=Rhodococcus coprophilus TaxID=38310 RepID=A0A2X4XI94_9NOCA|nr:DNA-binding GntR family transcriptional regulator [Rhodococcus coprophilus]SQI36334.1 GntR family transcriptional regulator [Rhodococcus coprophilus]